MKNLNFFEAARAIAFLVIGGSILAGFLGFRTIARDQRILLLLLVSGFVAEVVALILWWHKINNYFVYHFYTIAEFVLLAMLYKVHLRAFVKETYIAFLMFFFVFFSTVNTLFFQGLSEFNSRAALLECVLLIILSVLYFLRQLVLPAAGFKSMMTVPMFWINIAVLTYFSGSLVLLYATNEMAGFSQQERVVIWGIHAIFNVVHYFFCGVAICVRPPIKGLS